MTRKHLFPLLLFLLMLLLPAGCEKSYPVIDKPDEKDEPGKPDEPGTAHIYPTPVQETAIAFPGAQGGGMQSSGGRGGKVYRVTSSEDTGVAGTLRHALMQSGKRIIIFDTGGTIFLKSRLTISNGDVTIAGQSAPGGGITLAGWPVEVKADNVIIRYLRFRMGDIEGTKVGADGADALSGRGQKNIIIDHCSMSWSTDECSSFYDNENFTMQWCILSESLRLSLHAKEDHGYGGIWGGQNASFLYNLLAHHDSRNPRFCGSRYTGLPELERVDFRNNVIFNWGANTAYGAEGGSYNLVSNYFKAGPESANRGRIIQPYADDGGNVQAAGTSGRFYLQGNYVNGYSAVTADNSLGVHLHNNTFNQYAPGTTLAGLLSSTPFQVAEAKTFTAKEAFTKVLAFAGSSKSRDAVDNRIVEETGSGIPQFTGLNPGNSAPYPKPGIIDSQDDTRPADAATGWSAWPQLAAGSAPADSDGDGMPDAWEIDAGLDPKTPDAGGRHLSTGYDNIEVWLNSLVKEITEEQYR